MYTGSFGRGESDKYSDLDIELVVNDKFLSNARENIKFLIGKLGKLKLIYFLDNMNIKSIIDDYQKIDFKIHKKENMTPWGKYSKIKIIKDKNNLLKEFSKKAKEFNLNINQNFIEKEFKELVFSQIVNANRYARGWKWNVMDWINHRTQKLYICLMKIRGKIQFDFANVENLLSKNEMNMLEKAYCFKPEDKEIKKAIKSQWIFGKYVFKEFEKKTKKRLPKFEEKPFLKKIDSLLN
jgi:predicted nucleotidyltransferase